jgi:hypothetical protein
MASCLDSLVTTLGPASSLQLNPRGAVLCLRGRSQWKEGDVSRRRVGELTTLGARIVTFITR